MTIKYQISKSHWKDKRSGLYYWNISITCQKCGKKKLEHQIGTKEQIKDYCSASVNETCDKCLSLDNSKPWTAAEILEREG